MGVPPSAPHGVPTPCLPFTPPSQRSFKNFPSREPMRRMHKQEGKAELSLDRLQLEALHKVRQPPSPPSPAPCAISRVWDPPDTPLLPGALQPQPGGVWLAGVGGTGGHRAPALPGRAGSCCGPTAAAAEPCPLQLPPRPSCEPPLRVTLAPRCGCGGCVPPPLVLLPRGPGAPAVPSGPGGLCAVLCALCWCGAGGGTAAVSLPWAEAVRGAVLVLPTPPVPGALESLTLSRGGSSAVKWCVL